jgi:alkanesulfonate monooxygenase SsuD/methylene tetrahydromethanopterin reductase-like flavin-dependent oxidoreductase (luciferase family)
MAHIQFGVGHDLRNLDPSRRSWPDTYRLALDRVALADELGYDYMFIGEHHFTEDGHAPSLFPVFAAMAARTQRIKFNTFVFLLPLHHPLNVAEDVIAVDLISDGRMELGVGLGYRSEEFEAFGIDRSKRASIMDESCDILLKAWTEENWSYDGEHFQISDITMVPMPVQQPHPKLWVSARNATAARRAARLKAPLMIAPAPYVDDPAEVYAAYADALFAEGEDPTQFDVMGSYTVHVLADGEAPPEVGPNARLEQYIDWYAKDGDLATDATRIPNPSAELQEYIGFTGEAPACIDALETLVAKVPFTALMVGGLGRAQLERFAADVAPAFK